MIIRVLPFVIAAAFLLTSHAGASPRKIFFPGSDLFVPPIADLKQPHFYAMWQRYRSDFGTVNIGSVGLGDSIGLVRFLGKEKGDGVQIGVCGAVFAIFNMDVTSHDLLNADYVAGVPVSYRKKSMSLRARIYHLSSHLGDRYVLTREAFPMMQKTGLSYEAVELLGSYEKGIFRVYGGPTRIIASSQPIEGNRVQGGLEFRVAPASWRMGRLIAGCDVSGWEETDWSRDVSAKIGYEFLNPYRSTAGLQLFLEYYSGQMPHGVFYPIKVDYFSFGIAFSL